MSMIKNHTLKHLCFILPRYVGIGTFFLTVFIVLLCSGCQGKIEGEVGESIIINDTERDDEINVMDVKIGNGIVVNYDEVHQTIEGFGASGAWWAQDVGSWDNIDEIMDLLYDPVKGIGLNIYRHNINGGYPNKARDPWRSGETVEVSPGVYDLSRDEVAISVFKKAVERGAVNNVLFVNSPPARMTVSGYTSGANDGGPNLREDAEDDFARYCVDITKIFTEQGFNVKYISPINEPQWNWGGDNPSQEGCHYKPAQVISVGRKIAELLESEGVAAKLSLAESGTWYDEEYTLTMYRRIMDDEVLANHLDHYAVHSYWSDEKSKKKTALYFSTIDNLLPFHQTEWCQMEWGMDLGMDAALVLAKEVHDDMTILSVSSWSHWLAVSQYDYKDGLIYVNTDAKMFKDAKRMWALGNYSRFIKQGYNRLGISGDDNGLLVSAYANPENTETVIVVINQSEENRLLEFGRTIENTEVYITDEDNDSGTMFEHVINMSSYDIPKKSIVTFVSR